MPARGLARATTTRWGRIGGLLVLCASCRLSERPPELLPGKVVEEEIRPGEVQRYSLKLTAGDFVDLLVDQRGVDVATTLFSPAGEPLVKTDRAIGYQGPEPLLAVARTGGTYGLEVQALKRPRPPGRYRIEVREIRRATEADDLRAEGAALVSARKELRYALELWEALGDDSWQAETLYRLAHAEEDPEEEIRLYLRSAELFAKVGDLPMQGSILSKVGNLRSYAGAVEEAVSYHEQARSVYQKAGDRPGEAFTYTNLGFVRRTQGRYDEALAQYRRALLLWDEEMDRDGRALTLHNLGVLYRILGQGELAADCLKEAEREFSVLGKNDNRAASLNQLGKLFQERGDPEEALTYHRQALELRRQGKDLKGVANSLVDVGLAHQTLGRTDEALEAYAEALAVLRDLDRPRLRAKVLSALGSLYSAIGQEREALGYLEESLSLRRELADPAGEAESLFRISGAHAKLGDLPVAREAAGKAVDLVERVRLSAISPRLRSSFLSTVQPLFERQIDLLMRSHQEQPGAGYDVLALKESERARARSLLEMLAEAGTHVRSGAPPELLAREQELQEELNRRARELRLLDLDAQLLDPGTRNLRSPSEEEKKLREIAIDLDTVRSEIRARSPRYAALTQPRPIGLEEIQRQLAEAPAGDPGEKTLLLEYSLGEERSFLWLVARQGLDVFELPGRASLEPLARKAYRQLKRSNRPESHVSSRRFLCELSRMLLGPIADRLAEERLIVVADGPLQFIPFAALPDPRAPGGCAAAPPLVVGHEIVYLPSASVLAALRRETAARSPAPGLVAVLADPVFSPEDERVRSGGAPAPRSLPTAPRRFPRLDRSRREAEAILSLAPPDERWSAFDFDANKNAAFSGVLSRYRIVHFATHAVLDTSQPELSGLVLSQVDETGREVPDAFLRLHEIYNLDLPAELVVLSACNTALGQEVRGEGLVGLTRGFMYAGARRVLVSLWNVSEDSTSRLMRRFYEGLLREQLAPAAALRQAQVATWKEQPAPFYWAALVLEGEWGPLPPRERINKTP